MRPASISFLPLAYYFAVLFLIASMDPQNLMLEVLTLAAKGLTLNLTNNPDVNQIIDHCLIGCV
jgi:hypothetical protein